MTRFIGLSESSGSEGLHGKPCRSACAGRSSFLCHFFCLTAYEIVAGLLFRLVEPEEEAEPMKKGGKENGRRAYGSRIALEERSGVNSEVCALGCPRGSAAKCVKFSFCEEASETQMSCGCFPSHFLLL